MIITASPNSKRIPTVLGILGTLALVVVVALTVRSLGQVTKLFSQAENPAVANFVGVANVADTSATIHWTTDQDVAGSVFYGKSAGLGDGVGVDQRDLSSQNSKYSTHLVHLANLKPNTKYFFKIGVGTQTSGDPERGGTPFEFTTGPQLTQAPLVDPIFGKVTDPSGVPVAGAIVVWETPGGGKIATLAKTDGNYVLPIGNARTADLGNYLSPSSGLPETINLNGGGNTSLAVITCRVGQDRPLPTIKLGETADCNKKSTSNNSGFKAPPASPVATSSSGLASINLTDGQTSTPLPTFSGKAGPNQVVQIIVRSATPYSGTVQADASGNWSWTPPANLTPGEHTVTITVVNADGTNQTVTKTFTVPSTSILPITSGTPSAQLTHLTCVSSACLAVAGVGPDACATNADCAPVPPPVPVATPTPVPTPLPPQTGSTENTLVMLTLGLIFATLGAVKVFQSNGSKQ